MTAPIDSPFLVDRWDEAHAGKLTPEEQLLYRSNLLGSDQRITNFGGGNTSAKLVERDPLTGEDVEVLWVKGSGGDLGSMGLDGFATLYLDKLLALKKLYRGPAHEDEMVAYLPHCTFDLNPRAASIDTPLHGFLPYRHVDHVHPDAVIAIAAARNTRELTLEIFGDTIGWLPWRRPGFELGLMLEKFCREESASGRRRPRKPRPLHLGRGRARLLPDDHRNDQQGHRLARREQPRQADLRGRLPRLARPLQAARSGHPPHAADPRTDQPGREEGRPFRRFAGGARIRQFQPAEGARRARHVLPGSLPPDQDPAAGRRRDRHRAGTGGCRLPGGLRRLLRALPARRQPADARSERRRLSGSGDRA